MLINPRMKGTVIRYRSSTQLQLYWCIFVFITVFSMQNEFKLKLVHTNTVLGFLFAKNYDSTKEKNTQVGEKEGSFLMRRM